MRIGLIDVDGHNFPNLPLMKISAYHKAQGDEVEWWWSDFIHYDIVYLLKNGADKKLATELTKQMLSSLLQKGGEK